MVQFPDECIHDPAVLDGIIMKGRLCDQGIHDQVRIVQLSGRVKLDDRIISEFRDARHGLLREPAALHCQPGSIGPVLHHGNPAEQFRIGQTAHRFFEDLFLCRADDLRAGHDLKQSLLVIDPVNDLLQFRKAHLRKGFGYSLRFLLFLLLLLLSILCASFPLKKIKKSHVQPPSETG